MADNKALRLSGLFLVLALSGWAQENRYMVFFTDKAGVSQTIENPIEFLSGRAIERRLDQDILITAEDLPVVPLYVSGIRDAGATPVHTTRWMNGVLVSGNSSALSAVAALPYVDRVEFVAPPAQEPSGGRKRGPLKKTNHHLSVENEVQMKMIGLDRMHLDGYDGDGVVIAILDSGFPGVDELPAFQHLFAGGKLDEEASYNFVRNSHDVFRDDDHGTEVLSVIAAEIADAYTGGASGAGIQLYVTEEVPGEYRIEEYNWLFAAERADSAGADIIHSSLGYYDFDDAAMNYSPEQMDGKTTVISRAATFAAARGIVVVTSAGNEGSLPSWRIITAPADAEDVLAIGSVNTTGQKVPSSSIGPAADGRTKPDLVALGSGVRVVKANGQISTASGTSLAAPLVTSLAAGVLQRHPGLTSRELISLLRQTASQAANPDNLLGYGIPNYRAIVNYRNDDGQEQPFEIYPNPVDDSDTLTLSPKDPEIFASCQIELVSSQGRILGSQRVKFNWLNRTYSIPLAGLPAGIYYVRVLSDKRKDTFKIVKL